MRLASPHASLIDVICWFASSILRSATSGALRNSSLFKRMMLPSPKILYQLLFDLVLSRTLSMLQFNLTSITFGSNLFASYKMIQMIGNINQSV